MIEPDLVNVFDVSIVRPNQTGPGMDPVGDDAVLYSNLEAIYEPVDEVVKDLDGRERFLSARFFIDPFDADGNVIDVQANQLIQWTQFNGRVAEKILIVRVLPWFCGRELDHIQIDAGGR